MIRFKKFQVDTTTWGKEQLTGPQASLFFLDTQWYTSQLSSIQYGHAVIKSWLMQQKWKKYALRPGLPVKASHTPPSAVPPFPPGNMEDTELWRRVAKPRKEPGSLNDHMQGPLQHICDLHVNKKIILW